MNFKEEVTEMVENVYDLTHDDKYDIRVDLIPRKRGDIKSGVKITPSKGTVHNIKWRSRN